MKRLRIDEEQVKALVLNELRAQGKIYRSATIASEFLLGKTGVRADLAIWADRFIGIEIKSELDSLRRLNHQLEASRYHFEQTILVVADKHVRGLETFDTSGVSIWVVDATGCLHSQTTSSWGAEINWRGLLNQRDLIQLCETAEPVAYRDQFSKFFRKRFGPYSDEFWSSVGRKKVSPIHLRHLSRFKKKRDDALLTKLAEDRQWAAWRAFGEMELKLAS